jgi:TPR repeat protein
MFIDPFKTSVSVFSFIYIVASQNLYSSNNENEEPEEYQGNFRINQSLIPLHCEMVNLLNTGEDQYNLGVLALESGDLEEARIRLTIAAEKNHPKAIMNIFNIGWDLNREEKYEEGHPWLLLAAQFNCPLAIYCLGMMAVDKRDLKTAQSWLMKIKSADGFDTLVKNMPDFRKRWQESNANLLAIGNKIAKIGNIEEAAQWWELAARFNNVTAQYNLGVVA